MTKDSKESQDESRSHFRKFWTYYLFILLEMTMIILYSQFTEFGKLTNPKNFNDETTKAKDEIKKIYPFYQDVHVMIFIGFGFLMTFLKKYSWSAVAKNFLLAAWTVQFAILTIGFWKAVLTNGWHEKIDLDLHKLVDADFAAGSILIAFGAVLGKLHFSQYLIMAIIQTIIYGLQMNVGFGSFKANDIGGSMTIHMFGAYFGVTVALMTKKKEVDKHPHLSSNYNSNLLSMIGTIFLWMFWPSFNGALSSGLAQYRTIINTLLSLTGSCVMVFLLTPFFKEGKFHMENILNATLAGGVIIGSTADIIIDPWVSFFIGCFGGSISLIGFEIIGPFLNDSIGLQDTCGVHSLHGIPGFLGGIISAVITATAEPENYGESYYDLFPALKDNKRTKSEQGGYQLATLAVSLGLAILGGVITGYILNSSCFDPLETYYDDKEAWVFEEDEHHERLNVENHHQEKNDNKNVNSSLNKNKEYEVVETQTGRENNTNPNGVLRTNEEIQMTETRELNNNNKEAVVIR